MVRVVGREARYGGDAQDAGGLVRRAAVKIVLGKSAHQPVAPKKQRQRLNDGGLAAVIRSDQHGMAAQRNIRRTHAPEAERFSGGQCAWRPSLNLPPCGRTTFAALNVSPQSPARGA